MDAGVLVPIAGMVTGIILGLPLVRLAVRYVERRVLRGGPGDADLRHEVDELRTRLDAMEVMRDRLADLEERQEFTERVLARDRERPGLSPGRS